MLLTPSAIDTHVSKDKSQIALRNGCEDHVASNYMVGLTAFNIVKLTCFLFFKSVMIFFK